MYIYIYIDIDIYIYELFIVVYSLCFFCCLFIDGMCGVMSGQVAIKRKYRHVW